MRYAALTDILGAEDAFGDMDFKVAGTREFVTAIQLDTKLDGIPASVLAGALTQARQARLHILDVMNEAIDVPDEMSPNAPRVITVNVPVDKIGEVIGPKGKMINQIQEQTGADISIEDDGTVYIGATDGPSAEAARAMVNAIANPMMPEVGERFVGTVVKTTTFGAFISLSPGQGRTPAHLADPQARRWQAGGQRRGRALRRPEGPGRDRRDRPARQAVAARGRRRVGRGRGRAGRRPTRPDVPLSLPLAGPGSELTAGQDGGAIVRRSVLPGGVRVLSESMPGLRSATVGAWVGVGSRDERDGHHGSTHFLEHLLFKGTARRSAMDIAEAFDAVGGEANAATGKEYTCYYARVLDADLPMAVDVIADMVTSASLDGRGARARARRDPRRARDERRRPERRRARAVRRGRARPRTRWAGRSAAPRGRSARSRATRSWSTTTSTTSRPGWSSPPPAGWTTTRCARRSRRHWAPAASFVQPRELLRHCALRLLLLRQLHRLAHRHKRQDLLLHSHRHLGFAPPASPTLPPSAIATATRLRGTAVVGLQSSPRCFRPWPRSHSCSLEIARGVTVHARRSPARAAQQRPAEGPRMH